MFVSNHNGKEYCFYDDHMTIDGLRLEYSKMTGIAHKAGDTPAIVFNYDGQRVTMPYNKEDYKTVLPYFIRANNLKHEVEAPAEPEFVYEPEQEPVAEAPAEPEFVYEEEPAAEVADEEYAEPETSAGPEYVQPEPEVPAEPEFVYEPEQEPVAEAPAEPEFVYEQEPATEAPDEEYAEPEAPTEEYVEEPVEEVVTELEAPTEEYVEEPVEEVVTEPEAPTEEYVEEPVEEVVTEPEAPDEAEAAASATGGAKAMSGKIKSLPERLGAIPKKTKLICAIVAAVIVLGIILFFLFMGPGKSVDGMDGRVSPKQITTEAGDKYRISTIDSDVDIETFVPDYYKKFFKDGDTVHWIINNKTNETIMLSDHEGTVLICLFDHVEGEEDDPALLGSGQLKGTWILYTDSGELLKV